MMIVEEEEEISKEMAELHQRTAELGRRLQSLRALRTGILKYAMEKEDK